MNETEANTEKRRMIDGQYWVALKKVAQECFDTTGSTDNLSGYLKQHYGIGMDLEPNKILTADFTVIDEQKYLIFIMKFM